MPLLVNRHGLFLTAVTIRILVYSPLFTEEGGKTAQSEIEGYGKTLSDAIKMLRRNVAKAKVGHSPRFHLLRFCADYTSPSGSISVREVCDTQSGVVPEYAPGIAMVIESALADKVG